MSFINWWPNVSPKEFVNNGDDAVNAEVVSVVVVVGVTVVLYTITSSSSSTVVLPRLWFIVLWK